MSLDSLFARVPVQFPVWTHKMLRITYDLTCHQALLWARTVRAPGLGGVGPSRGPELSVSAKGSGQARLALTPAYAVPNRVHTHNFDAPPVAERPPTPAHATPGRWGGRGTLARLGCQLSPGYNLPHTSSQSHMSCRHRHKTGSRWAARTPGGRPGQGSHGAGRSQNTAGESGRAYSLPRLRSWPPHSPASICPLFWPRWPCAEPGTCASPTKS